ncbi:MAG: hypothetical protein RL238_692 [Actinomycetota bacterium]|jgi:polysaccharide pyruvyl transferase WcaK-like protein
MMETNARKIVFLGTHGQYNIGDELLLETFLFTLGAEHRYVVNTYDPRFTSAQLDGRYEVELIDTGGDRRALLGHLRRCDAVVFGGGSIIKELYASTGRNRYSTLLMILAIVTFANVTRRPIAMLNIGVGPITTRTGRLLARAVLGQVDLLTVRDHRSYETCREIGLPASKVQLATDAVFAVDRQWLLGSDTTTTSPAPVDRPLRFALNLNYDIANPDNWELFNERLAAGLNGLHERRPIELHLLPMQAGFKTNDDVQVLDAFVRRTPDIPVIRHAPTTYQDVARIIDDCDLLVSERFHAIVIASLLATPSFVLAYDVKVSGLSVMLDLTDYTIDINTEFDASSVTDGLEQLALDLEGAARRVHEHAMALHAIATTQVEASKAWIGRTRGAS